jgi:hypothetical protein
MAWKLILAGLMLGTLGAVSAAGQRVEGWTGLWVQAPWASVRDGAEVDGSRPLPVFRREFTVKGKVQKATLRIAGLGQWEAHLGWANGTFLVGAPGLHQGWTDYRKTVRFESCDVTEAMRPGKMVLGVMLGNGMYNVQRSSLSGEGATGKARYTSGICGRSDPGGGNGRVVAGEPGAGGVRLNLWRGGLRCAARAAGLGPAGIRESFGISGCGMECSTGSDRAGWSAEAGGGAGGCATADVCADCDQGGCAGG